MIQIKKIVVFKSIDDIIQLTIIASKITECFVQFESESAQKRIGSISQLDDESVDDVSEPNQDFG